MQKSTAKFSPFIHLSILLRVHSVRFHFISDFALYTQTEQWIFSCCNSTVWMQDFFGLLKSRDSFIQLCISTHSRSVGIEGSALTALIHDTRNSPEPLPAKNLVPSHLGALMAFLFCAIRQSWGLKFLLMPKETTPCYLTRSPRNITSLSGSGDNFYFIIQNGFFF